MFRKKSDAKPLIEKEQIPYAVLLAPCFILFFLCIFLPVICSIVLSFFSFDMVSAPSFAGADNYIRMFLDDDVFLTTLKNTLLLAVLTGPAGFLLSFI